MIKKQAMKLYSYICADLTEKQFLEEMGLTKAELLSILEEDHWNLAAEKLLEKVDHRGRFCGMTVVEVASKTLWRWSMSPEEGWLTACYQYVLGRLFPQKHTGSGENQYARGRIFLLQLFRTLGRFEREYLPFDPTMDMQLLTPEEVAEGGYTSEYKKFEKLFKEYHIYEFMRIGTEITPFNTLGHIAGVHYVAMHVARQLAALKVPVDLAMVSGAAAGHDIGKYGCRKSEERRIPYLHYYYTDLCFQRFRMPTIGHIAANHSTWDLELENLPVESLILIYADFRVKSSRNKNGEEIVHFYSLEDSFQVILDKLDNVDAAKERRYRKVYNKLKDFEAYMIDRGVLVNLPDVAAAVPNLPEPKKEKNVALLRHGETIEELKYEAIDHNIRLMNTFYAEEEFASLLEQARSEKQWKILRTYISILGEYSTYMTEKQKLMTLRFLYELLVHRESDIRSQAGEIIGQIIAKFNDEYKKELPEGVELPEKKVTNFSLWEEYLDKILCPDYKLTEQHKKWIENCLNSVIRALLANCRVEQREFYVEGIIRWMEQKNLTALNKEALLRAATSMEAEWCTEAQKDRIIAFSEALMEEDSVQFKIAASDVKQHYGRMDKDTQEEGLKRILGISSETGISQEALSDMFLDNMKAKTPWILKVANISLMLRLLQEDYGAGQALHVATHLSNLVKVSETVTVRRAAGDGLLEIISMLPLEQRNEIAVELGKGLEIGDYQFSKYIPDYLGIIMLHLPPQELDELILDLEKLLEKSNGQVGAAVLNTFGVMLENYRLYSQNFGEEETAELTEARRFKVLNRLIRGFANYNKAISQEAIWTIGTHLFGSEKLSLKEKYELFCHCGKKLLTIYKELSEDQLGFFNNAAVLSHIYRFISLYEVEAGELMVPEKEKVAFFPGTFDPFSLSHKEIAKEIRDMGYEVYLALDEFSWSKKTQPRLQRRRIMSMSVADEGDIYIFPDDIPVNIANPEDLKKLKEIFKGRKLYFVAGSDVIENASCYRAEPQEDSIHSINHIIFERTLQDPAQAASTLNHKAHLAETRYPISGEIRKLHLEAYYEDISSTRIRENIDLNRDISNLIDPVAQNYIFENSMYLREPAYKHVIQARDIKLEPLAEREDRTLLDDFEAELAERGYDVASIKEKLSEKKVKTVYMRDGLKEHQVVALAAVKRLDSIDLLKEFHDQEIAATIRKNAAGIIGVLGGFFFSKNTSIADLGPTILTEILSELLARDYTYVVYHPWDAAGLSGKDIELLEKQGFVNIAPQGKEPIYAVDMKSPVIIFNNVETVIKNPLNKNKKVLKAVEQAHTKLLHLLNQIYPGELILSFNAGIMHHKMIGLITQKNGVDSTPYEKKSYGPCMAVPFGKILEGIVVPNTVTKALHTEKYFFRGVDGFTIEESSYYSTLNNQVKTIKSFRRPVILVDDLIHKGYRMQELDPILTANQVEVENTIVGVLTGRGRDLMTVKNRRVDSAYYMPDLKCWIDESDAYPYLGGDSIKNRDEKVSRLGTAASLNLILPFAVPAFLEGAKPEQLYEYSMTCLENARDILRTLEEEYQNLFERKLTIRRLGEVITSPKRPDLGSPVLYDENVAASAYVEKDIERLNRLKRMFK